jgi:membrane dipeptidase
MPQRLYHIAKKEERTMLIIDAHEDIAYNALEWGRDIRDSVHVVREREGNTDCCDNANASAGPGGIAMSGLPELRRGGIGVVFGVIFAYPLRNASSPAASSHTQAYRTAEEAYRVGREQLAYYQQLAQEPGISLIQNANDLQRVLADWHASSADDKERPLGIVPLMEGADAIRTPDEAAQWFAEGVRIVGLAWSGTRYSGGTGMPGPLTAEGKALLREMERVGLILDTSHLAEESFWQALEQFQGPIIASHSNCRAFTPTDRHLSDDMIRALAARDSVIGMVPVNYFLHGDWSSANRFPIGLDQMVRHIDHICQLVGDARHVGIGSDIDGGFGRDETPEEMDTVADLAKLADALRIAGYKEDDIVGIMSGNWQRFLERALPKA